MKYSYILQIDTSLDFTWIGIGQNGQLTHELRDTATRNHAAVLHDLINELLNNAGLNFQDLSAIAVIGGPGSYTGLRIALSAAKGFCYALDIPLIMHNSLPLLVKNYLSSHEMDNNSVIATVMYAREGECFMYIANGAAHSVFEPKHLSNEEANDVLTTYGHNLKAILFTNAADILDVSILDSVSIKYDQWFTPQIWVQQSFEDYQEKIFHTIEQAEPFYMKAIHISKPKSQ